MSHSYRSGYTIQGEGLRIWNHLNDEAGKAPGVRLGGDGAKGFRIECLNQGMGLRIFDQRALGSMVINLSRTRASDLGAHVVEGSVQSLRQRAPLLEDVWFRVLRCWFTARAYYLGPHLSSES